VERETRSRGKTHLPILYRVAEKQWLLFPLEALSFLAIRKNQVELAARLYGTRWSQASLNFLSPAERTQREKAITETKASLGEERFSALYKQDQQMKLEQAVAHALEELS
jgi:hypothetical protein